MTRIGVDTGGTFTDLVLLTDDGLRVHKVRSTPHDPARAILDGIIELAGNRIVDEVTHGSTVATNAVLERKGARIALITTRGFEDVLRIGRQTRSLLYDFQVPPPRAIIDPALTFGIDERMSHRGEVLQPLDTQQVKELAARLTSLQVECVAVCLLHSYANFAHEEAVFEILHNAGLNVSLSHRVLPQYREYERWSTTVLNAYVAPIMSRYLTTLERGLPHGRLHIMQSNGGILSAAQARQTPVRTVLSGPAAGAVGAAAVARASGFSQVILFDMGGTSTDVTLVDGHLGSTSESSVGDFPLRLSTIDIHTVGAGGGSIAWVDSGGSLRVGPRSAGAEPGPVCYGRGEELTVSDANLLLGRLPARYFLGGRMQLDVQRTIDRCTKLAADLGLTVERLAEGIVEIANANMERAIRAVSIQRGYDPRDFALLAFGGAGGMHACEVAETIEIDTILIPRHAGVLSALGMLLADVRKDYSRTILVPASTLTPESLEALFTPLISKAETDLVGEGFASDRIVIERLLEVRFQGQAYEIAVPANSSFEQEFHRRHQSLYGYANPSRPTEVVNISLRATGITDKCRLSNAPVTLTSMPQPLEHTQARFHHQWHSTPVYRSEDLAVGASSAGPAILVGGEATIVIPPNFRFRVDGVETIIATRVEPASLPAPAETGQREVN
jgi:N-methylhydantoinase A/oxoprolinase/acetone carboxylase beta subunit